MIKKLLIANRGEIAIRIIRTCQEMGIRTVAVYSEADATAMHTQMADEAVLLGASEPAHSYLSIEKLIAAAKDTGADAIHPGYGFLSERAEFVQAIEEAGLIFIGPPPAAMKALGAKIEAKQLAESMGVPVTPGLFEIGATPEQLRQAAIDIGFPVMLKASAGGGGRGMRVVWNTAELDAQLVLASEEALKAFGDGAMMVEKFVERPRHIEIQLMADKHGNVAPLFERECSIQRRHQKLLEETPSPLFGPDHPMWPQMRDSAVKLAKAAGYVGAGTMEFMVEPDGSAYYFLELNARLQVEHPVTECITGLDLVKLQIEVAQGGNLQELVPDFLEGNRQRIQGHSIEARLVAEDPSNNFLPSVGKILAWASAQGPGVRVDTGFGPGSEVSRFYDSMLAKVITHGPDRETSVKRLIHALSDFHVLGVKTNISYLIEVLSHPEFQSGAIDTGFLARNFDGWKPSEEIPVELGAILSEAKSNGAPASTPSSNGQALTRPAGAWDISDSWRVSRV